jgi:NTP pyrophosphatase (non-canonical NTP hydrolase)
MPDTGDHMPNEPSATDQLSLLQQKVDEFSQQRDWEKFHTPKNLTMALTVEAAELMEIFQWQEGAEGIAGLSDNKRQAVEHEVADIFIYLLRFCSVSGIDLLKAAEDKLKLNSQKYPAELVKGKSKKYTEY